MTLNNIKSSRPLLRDFNVLHCGHLCDMGRLSSLSYSVSPDVLCEYGTPLSAVGRQMPCAPLLVTLIVLYFSQLGNLSCLIIFVSHHTSQSKTYEWVLSAAPLVPLSR
jgi:hypothetical protein